MNNKIKVGRDKGNVGAGQIPTMRKLAEAVRKRVDREFRRGYRTGADDVKGMGLVDIVRVVEGDLKMSRLVHYHRHRREEVSESYLEGWIQAVRDAHKKTGEGSGCSREDRWLYSVDAT